MDGRYLKLRTAVILGVIAVFGWSIHPLTPRDFYRTFRETLRSADDPAAAGLVAAARERQSLRPGLNPAAALLEVADERGADLSAMVEGSRLSGNADAIALVRRKAAGSIRPGLDLAGGVEFQLELVPDRELLEKFRAEGVASGPGGVERRMAEEFDRYRDQAIETLRRRLEARNIFESEITPCGGRSVSLKAPVTSRDEKDKLLELIRMSCKLSFRLVHPQSAGLLAGIDPATFRPPAGYELLSAPAAPGGEPVRLLVSKRAEMDGRSIVRAQPVRDEYGQNRIAIEFDSAGAARFAEITARHVKEQLAIVLDGKLACAPEIQGAIAGGRAEITGRFSTEEAGMIADALTSGSFPFQIEVSAIYDTAPSLGADNVANGVFAGLLAAGVLTLFMCGYYFRAGMVAVLALAANVVLILGAMAAFGATLTMPGIAGIILTLGMAVDANVLVFERIREELSAGKTLASAVDTGYGKAFSAVLDGNLTTLISAVILMFLGSGPVKGFAVSLTIGIISSMFTALCLTRLVFDWALRGGRWKTLRMCRVFHNPSFDFLGKRKWAFGLSGILILGSCLLFCWKGERMLGVDFTGGTRIVYSYRGAVPAGELEHLLRPLDSGVRIVYKSNPSAAGDRKLEILLRDRGSERGVFELADKVGAMINTAYPELAATDGEVIAVGGAVGDSARSASLWAVVAALAGMSIYIALRFRISFAAAGILALIHDVIISLGIFILLGREMSLPVIAALLTIIGYSINDTIVIFDRIREDLGLMPERPFADVINISINRTLSRTLLTSFTTFLVVAVMFCFGGVVINDFVLLMMLGIVIGTYSSIFIASPLALRFTRFSRREKRMGKYA